MESLFLRLVSQLKTHKGRKQYGYLPHDMKETVNKIVAEIAKDGDIAKLYSEWNRVNREKLSLYYDKKKPDIPLEDNSEFRSIKNIIVRSATLAMRMAQVESTPGIDVSFSVQRVAFTLCQLISQSYTRKLERLNSQIDSKLRLKIEEKKAALGLKTDRSVQQYSDDEEQDMRM